MMSKPIGEYIKLSRSQRGWSLRELSDESGGLSISFLSDLERGRSDPSLKTLIAIGKAFCMGAGDLLTQAGYTVYPIYPAVRTAQVKVTLFADGSAEARVLDND